MKRNFIISICGFAICAVLLAVSGCGGGGRSGVGESVAPDLSETVRSAEVLDLQSQIMIQLATDLENYVLSFPPSAFSAPGDQAKLLDALDKAIEKFRANKIEQGMNQIESDVLNHLDGCFEGQPPVPQNDDWLIACPDSNSVREGLVTLICVSDGGGIASIDISVANDTLNAKDPPQPFAATATLNSPSANPDCPSDNQLDVTNSVDWNSSNAAVGTIDSSGLFQPVGAGQSVVTAGLAALASNAVTMTVKSGAGRFYFSQDNSYSYIDLEAPPGFRTETGPFARGGSGRWIVASNNQSQLYLMNYFTQNIAIFDAAANMQLPSPLGNISRTGDVLLSEEVNQSLNLLYVASHDLALRYSELRAYDISSLPATLVFTVPHAAPPDKNLGDIICVESKNKIYVSQGRTDVILVYEADTGKPVAQINLGATINPMAPVIGLHASLDPNEDKIFMTGLISGKLYVIDTTSDTLQSSFQLPFDHPAYGSPSLDGSKLYLPALDGNGSVYVVNTSNGAVSGIIPLGGLPAFAETSGDGSTVMVTSLTGEISLIDTEREVVDDVIIPANSGPTYKPTFFNF